LTDAQLSSSFAVTTGHDVDSTDWSAFARIDTLVILMGGSNLGAIAQRLVAHGRPPTTPVAVIRAAGTAEQRVWRSRLGSVAADTAGSKLSPCIVVVGPVAGGVGAAAAGEGEAG